MYFPGLCLRNGYGVAADKDRATYWLKYADSRGSTQARQELAAIAAENHADSARELLENIHNAALPQQEPVNSFVKVANKLPAAEVVTGHYMGYLLQYDWSGKNVVQARAMVLELDNYGGRITGEWVESGTDSFRFSSSLRGDSLVFDPVSYGRTDHYSPDSAMTYDLKGASFNVVQGMDRVCLAGNVTMFSPDRGSPSKPTVLALSRETKAELPEILLTGTKVFPNPFHDALEIRFTLGADATVSLSLSGVSGQQVYLRQGERLYDGSYGFRLQPPAGLAPGTYFLVVTVNGKRIPSRSSKYNLPNQPCFNEKDIYLLFLPLPPGLLWRGSRRTDGHTELHSHMVCNGAGVQRGQYSHPCQQGHPAGRAVLRRSGQALADGAQAGLDGHRQRHGRRPGDPH